MHREINAADRLVTPGFVDIHTHYDGQASWDPWLTPSSWHVVTTVVAGNCGVGFGPVHADRHDWLIALMGGVEDIPGSALAEGITWEWETFLEFLDAVARVPKAIDCGFLVAHGPVRGHVMGDRGARNEIATADDRAQMHEIVRVALENGAVGVSTSRTSLHRAKDGQFVPGTFADAAELDALARAMAEAGRGVFQLAMEHPDVPAQLPLLRAFAQRSGCTVSVNLNQTDHAPTVWREVMEGLEQARSDGIGLVAQVAGRSVGVIECLEGSTIRL